MFSTKIRDEKIEILCPKTFTQVKEFLDEYLNQKPDTLLYLDEEISDKQDQKINQSINDSEADKIKRKLIYKIVMS